MSLMDGAPRPPGSPCRWGRVWGASGNMWCLMLMLWVAPAAAITVSLSSVPPSHAIRPDTEMARVTLAAQRDGQPLSHGHVQVKVTAPPHRRLFSTDFPVVEATTLLELASDLRDGTFAFDYLFPIRGVYTFDVALSPVSGAPSTAPTTVQTSLQLHENPAEIRHAWLLMLGLFILGGVFGLVLARSAAAKSALLLTAILVSTVWVMRVEGNMRMQTKAAQAQQVVRGENGWALSVTSTPTHGTVGQPVQFDIALTKDGNVFAEATQVSIDLHHIEDDKPIFKTRLYAPTGATAQRLQFFDGAPHRVAITAHAATPEQAAPTPLQVVFDMDVEGIHPPLAVQFRTLALLIGVLTMGMVVGWFVPVRSKETGVASIC